MKIKCMKYFIDMLLLFAIIDKYLALEIRIYIFLFLFSYIILNQKCMHLYSNRLLLSIGKTKAILLSSYFITTPPDCGLHKDKTRIKKCSYIQTKDGSKGMFIIKCNNSGSNGGYLQNARYSESTPLLFDKNQILWSRPSLLQRTEQSSMLLTL